MAGGINGVKQASSAEFPVDQTYAHEAPAQPAITETASLTAPTAISYVRGQDKNVCQIHHEAVNISYAKMSNMAALSGLSLAGQAITPANEKDFQIMVALQKTARDVEFSILQGVYALAANSGEANKTRGLNAAAGTTLAAGSAQLTKTHLKTLLKAMFDGGAVFQNSVIIVNAYLKQALSEIYAYAPMDRNVGGVNIKQIETDFGLLGVQLNPFQLTSTLLVADMAFVNVVSQPVPGKGHMFYEELSKTGAAEKGQIYGQIGLDHGPSFMHGTITGLATS